MAPYFKKHQTYDPPEKEHPNKQYMPIAAKDRYHGASGPIHTSFNDYWEVSGLNVMGDKRANHSLQPFEEDFCTAAYEVGGKESTLKDAWSGDHMGFYSSLAAVSRTDDPGRRSYAASGYLRPNLSRPNLKVLTEALATKVVVDGNTATGVEFTHGGQKQIVQASKEVILSGGVINSPQLLELSGIGDPEVLEAAGVECKVKNERVGANFQDHVLGGMLYDLKDGTKSLDSLHDPEYQKSQEKVYLETGKGPYGSPGMLMGFVSYASLVGKEVLDQTIADIRKNSLAKTDFEKRQEDVVVKQLSDPNFANIQTFCEFLTLHSLVSSADLTRYWLPTRRQRWRKPDRVFQRSPRRQDEDLTVGVSGTPSLSWHRPHHLIRPNTAPSHRSWLLPQQRRCKNHGRGHQVDGQGSQSRRA